jgi:hypothetical protein
VAAEAATPVDAARFNDLTVNSHCWRRGWVKATLSRISLNPAFIRGTLRGMETPDDPGRRVTLDYASPQSLPPQPMSFVRLESLPLNEAELARLKLESEGITCFIAGQHISTVDPSVFHSVELMVNPMDLQRAREILDAPADDAMEGEYVEEPWRCPKCHRKGLEMLPAAGLRKTAWYGWWAVAVILAINIVMDFVNAGAPRAQQAWNAIAGWSFTPAMIAFGCVSFYLIVGQRQKVCPKCGWRS